jgi:hypothetical protein
MGIFTKNRTSNIGLDVSSTAVKLLEFGKELVDNEPRYRILNYAVVPLPTNAIVEKSVADVGDLPYLGFMFKNEYIVDETNELLIFITPKILSDTVAFC